MALLLQPDRVAAPAPPDAGAIREARTRQLRRRRSRYAGAAAFLALGAVIAWAAGGSGAKPSPAGSRGGRAVFGHSRLRRVPVGWSISPALEGGSYGWCLQEGGGGASCATVPAETRGASGGTRAIGSVAGVNISKDGERFTALVGSAVRGVLANGRPAALVVRARLEYGLRMVQIDVRRHTAFPTPGAAQAPALPAVASPSLLATGNGGRPLGYLGLETAAAPRIDIRWWAKGQPLPAGPCQIRAQGLPALEPEWGHVVARIAPYPLKIMGRAFFSCIDSEYYLHNWPLETSILLDAQSPGRPPAPIPGMKPVGGQNGLFNAPGGWHGEITATRHGNGWLVVAGGSGLAQRIEVLRHLRATVSARAPA